MIEDCPLNLECKVVHVLRLDPSEDIFIGEIVEVYADPAVLTGGMPDVKKINPIVFSMHDNNYWKVGERLGAAWSIGKDYINSKE